MHTLLHPNPRTLVPDLIDWFEEPFITLRPYLAQALPVEEYAEDDHYVVRAELAGVDPDNDVEVGVGPGYLTIRAVRHGTIEGKRRTEFRYGAFSRTLTLPPDADADAVTAGYANGILTVTIGIAGEKTEPLKKIQVKTDR